MWLLCPKPSRHVLINRSRSHSFRNAACAPGMRRISSLNSQHSNSMAYRCASPYVLVEASDREGGLVATAYLECPDQASCLRYASTASMPRSRKLWLPTPARALHVGLESFVFDVELQLGFCITFRFCASRLIMAFLLTSSLHSAIAMCFCLSLTPSHSSGHISKGRVVFLVQRKYRPPLQFPRGSHVAGS
jgi:hypothetical protein